MKPLDLVVLCVVLMVSWLVRVWFSDDDDDGVL